METPNIIVPEARAPMTVSTGTVSIDSVQRTT